MRVSSNVSGTRERNSGQGGEQGYVWMLLSLGFTTRLWIWVVSWLNKDCAEIGADLSPGLPSASGQAEIWLGYFIHSQIS